MMLRCRDWVDRIDRTPDGKRAWVIDYKSGSTYGFKKVNEEDPLSGGKKLQLPVYLYAAGEGVKEAQALYWFITRKGGFQRFPFKNTPGNMKRFESTLAAIVEGIRAGAFPFNPGKEGSGPKGRAYENCAYCEFDRICPRRRDPEQKDDAGLEPWLRVGRVARGEEA